MAVDEASGSTSSTSYQVLDIYQETGWEILTTIKDARQGGGKEGRPLERSRRAESAHREGANSSDLKTIPGTPLIEEQREGCV